MPRFKRISATHGTVAQALKRRAERQARWAAIAEETRVGEEGGDEAAAALGSAPLPSAAAGTADAPRRAEPQLPTAAALRRRLESAHAELLSVCAEAAQPELGGEEGIAAQTVLSAALIGLTGAVRHAEAAMAPIKAQHGAVLTAGDLLTAPGAPENNSLKRMRPACLEPSGGRATRRRTAPAAAAAAATAPGAGGGLAEVGGAAAAAEAEPAPVPEAQPLVAVRGPGRAKMKPAARTAGATRPAGSAKPAEGAVRGAAGTAAPSQAKALPSLATNGAAVGPSRPLDATRAGAARGAALPQRLPAPVQRAAAPAPLPPVRINLPLSERQDNVCPNTATCGGMPRVQLVFDVGAADVTCRKCGVVWNRGLNRVQQK